ncbi:MAG TPA: hypothetical protein VMB47_13280 [Candidatus Aquilonibacter sp.]|nr:hypothetical protein [Candidatus Aquilonibacter sp.]
MATHPVMELSGPFVSAHCVPGDEARFQLLPNGFNTKFDDVAGRAYQASLYGLLDYPLLLLV